MATPLGNLNYPGISVHLLCNKQKGGCGRRAEFNTMDLCKWYGADVIFNQIPFKCSKCGRRAEKEDMHLSSDGRPRRAPITGT